MAFEQKRNAERLPLDTPIDGSAGGMPVKIVELSAIGCKIEHTEKLALNSTITLKFPWKDFPVELPATVMRMQLRPGMSYESGLKFADSLAAAPDIMRAIVASIAKQELPPEIAIEILQPEEAELVVPIEFEDIVIEKRVPAREPEPAAPALDLVECRLENGTWHRRQVTAVHQPDEGFITQPASDAELDELCKTYGYADPDTRRLIRITLELTATQKRD